MTDAIKATMRNLLLRAGVSQETLSEIDNDNSLCVALEVVVDMLAEGPSPDSSWWKERYEVTGEHVVLTEEGWMPAEMNTVEHTGEEPVEVLDEVNAPHVAAEG